MMKKSVLIILGFSMCLTACGDGDDATQEREALAEGQYENLEDAFTRDEATIDAFSRCDVAAATIYNDDELLACELAFESCSNIEVQRLTNKLECEAGLTDNAIPSLCDPEQTGVSPECQAGYATLTPPNNGAMDSFYQTITGTNWCGPGGDIVSGATPCPNNSDDYACHRHDHMAKGWAGGPIVKISCDVDKDLATATSHWAAQAVFGNWGIAAAWGCYDYGRYNCWQWKSKWWGGYWSYGGYCHGDLTRYGPWRYSQYSHSFGYREQVQGCANPLPFRARNCPTGLRSCDAGQTSCCNN
jgi:hypothetical protein